MSQDSSPQSTSAPVCPDCGHAASVHSHDIKRGCYECDCHHTSSVAYILAADALASRVAELEAALNEIAYGSFGKSVAVKRIAREALQGGVS